MPISSSNKLHLTESDWRALYEAFDLDQDGTVSTTEFLAYLKHATNPEVQANSVLRDLSTRVRIFIRRGGDFSSLFRSLDPSFRGSIGRADLRKGLKKLGVKFVEALSEDDIDAVLKRMSHASQDDHLSASQEGVGKGWVSVNPLVFIASLHSLISSTHFAHWFHSFHQLISSTHFDHWFHSFHQLTSLN